MTESHHVSMEPPTDHPFYSEGRHPKVNTFRVRPVRNLGSLGVGDTILLNLATYIDPFSERQVFDAAKRHSPWVQGVNMEVHTLREPRWGETIARTVYPKDLQVTGEVVSGANTDMRYPVIGTLHPEFPGWLAFDTDIGLADPISPTIADLKAVMGKIDPSDVEEYREDWVAFARFSVGDQQFS